MKLWEVVGYAAAFVAELAVGITAKDVAAAVGIVVGGVACVFIIRNVLGKSELCQEVFKYFFGRCIFWSMFFYIPFNRFNIQDIKLFFRGKNEIKL